MKVNNLLIRVWVLGLVILCQSGFSHGSAYVGPVKTILEELYDDPQSLTTTLIQDITVSGTVKDTDGGEALPGVNIVIDGTGQGTVTDLDGNFTLTVADANAVLVFSFVGFEPQKVTVGSQTQFSVSLVTTDSFLKEVVVTGYGSQLKKEITGSVASVKSEDFNKGNTYAAAQLIQGKVAGLTIARAGANPSKEFQFRLRGLSTTGPNSSPLVVVDGVIGVSLSTVDPNDIASIDVLKDASAAAIYGTRGASGVIIITTKRSTGKPKIEYNGNIAFENVSKAPEVMNREEFLAFGGGTDLGDDVDWFEEISQAGVSQYHNVSLSGGAQGTSYRASFNYRDVQGIQKKTGWEQLNARINLSQKAINDKLTVDLTIAATTRESVFGNDRIFKDAQIMNPTAPIFSDDPNFEPLGGYFQQFVFDTFNPVAIMNQTRNEGTSSNLMWDIKGTFEIIDGLSVSTRYSQQIINDERRTFTSRESFYRGDAGSEVPTGGHAGRSERINKFSLFESTAVYDVGLGDLNLRLLGGYSLQDFDNQGFSAGNNDFLTDEFSFNNIGAGQGILNGLASVSSFKNTSRLVAFFGRVNLNYNDTYFLTASLRREGSSMFGDNEKWGNFPGLSAGVAIHNMLGLPSQVSALKLRASWGKTGNLPSQPYLSLVQYGVGSNFFSNGEYIPSTQPISNANPDLKWEEQTEFDIGLDFGFFGNKLTGTIDYYSRTTEGSILFFPVKVPPNLFPNTWINVGELKNTGLELSLNWADIVNTGKFTYSAGVTFTSYLSNEIVSLATASGESLAGRGIAILGSPQHGGVAASRIDENAPIGNFFGFNFEGFNADGSWAFTDLNNDGIIDDNDMQVIGNGLPEGEWGFNNTFTYGNWDLNIFFRGVFGHEILNGQRAYYEVPVNISLYNLPKSTVNVAELTEGSIYNSSFIEDGSFFKLENLSLGYNFDLPSDSWASNLRLYVAGQNLFVITDYQGLDPEVRYSDKNSSSVQDLGVLAPGIDRLDTWARTYTVSFGVNVGF